MIIEVNSRKIEKEFLEVPRILYKGDPFWVCALDNDIRKTFDPGKNKNFREGDAARWVLKDEKGKLIGRIAAFYNMKKARAEKVLAGGAGYFECINDPSAAHQLFDTAKNWLASRGLKAMDAPVHFGENDSNWGLLVEGFTHPGIGMPYHKPYYADLFRSYGFHTFFKQFTFHLDLTRPFPERFWKIAEWIGKKPDFTFRHFSWKDSEKMIRDAVYIYEKAWSALKEDFTPLDPDLLRETLKASRAIIDGEMIWFAYHKEEPISFFIMFPDANQILKKLNGKLHFLNLLRFLYYRQTGAITRIRAIAAGVIPKFQNSGVESGIFWHMNEKMKFKPQYKEIELSWVGDFNPKMLALYQNVGGVRAKTHMTLRYLFDQTIPFERFMPEKVNTDKLKEIDDNFPEF